MNPSIWEMETFYRHRDIMIIGAGFTGLWTAISIKEKFPAASVLVVERSAVPMGASTRNAGFACFGSLTEIIADSGKMGWDKTLELVQMRFDGLQKIRKYFKPGEIDFELCGGYEILKDGLALERMNEVNEHLKKITGLKETFSPDNEKLKELGLANADILVSNPCEGSLHSGKLLQKLLEKCQQLGIEFLFGTEVSAISENDNTVQVKTNNFEISTDKLIIATNAFTNDLIPEINLVPVRGQILLTEPIENLQLKGTFHYDEGFYYFRNLGNRILLGGARNLDFKTEETSVMETTDILQNHLEDFLKSVLLPNQDFRIAYRWSGIMAMGTEKSPVVQKISPRQIVAVRLSGMGVALAPKIGEMVAEMIG
ncbi:MAG: NAD(P)/FAD-dependent oxidoreductase [Kaistella sp.]